MGILHKRRFYLWIILILYLVVCYWYKSFNPWMWYSNETSPNKVIEAIETRLLELVKEHKGSGCEMPVLDPFDKTIMGFYHDVPDRVECPGQDWVDCHLSKCFIIDKVLAEIENIECIYQDIVYVHDDYYCIGRPTKVYENETYSLNRSDQVKITCFGAPKNRYSYKKSRWQGFKAGYRPVQQTEQTMQKADSPNILVLIYESISMNAFIRRLPKSYKFLKEELNAVFLKSYNIVGDGSASALTPLLTGHTELELPTINERYLDAAYLIFSVMKKNGYRTGYFEDCADFSTFTFSYNSSISDNAPADHYLRPFFLELFKATRYKANKRICSGSVPTHLYMLNHTAQMFKLDGNKFSLTFSVGLSHDHLSDISMADGDLVQFLKTFRDDGRLEDTALFVMGDHGHRFASLRNTYQGKIEERLPLVSVILPERFRRGRPRAQNNLEANSRVLTTPFDIHTTLLDIAGLKDLRNKYFVPGTGMERGLSLLDKIPKSRSCPEAGIMPHWCACASWNKVDLFDPLYTKIAQALALRINSITEDLRSQCAPRDLVAIEWVVRHSPSKEMLGYHHKENRDRYLGKYAANFHVKPPLEYYQAQIKMSPGNAIYEGSVQYVRDTNDFVISETDISRINAYGDDPKCIFNTHVHLRKYCYCY